jgi:hypothetical protein
MQTSTKAALYVIEASIKNTGQWSVFEANTGHLIFAHKSQKTLREVLRGLREVAAYSLLSFRITPYQPMETTTNANRTRGYLTNQHNSQSNQEPKGE